MKKGILLSLAAVAVGMVVIALGNTVNKDTPTKPYPRGV